MQLSSEEMLTLQLRRRSFQLALADLRVQGALIAATPGSMPYFAVCPCCGYPTLRSRGDYDVCPICSWEDDNQDDAAADDIRGGPNGDYSLTEARRNFIDDHTKYRAADERYSSATHAYLARDRVIGAYDELLPDVFPWTFISAMPRIDALHTLLYDRKYGKQKARKRRCAGEDERRRADREWEIWRAVARGTLPKLSDVPPSIQRQTAQLFDSIASRVSNLLEARLGSDAPVVAHRNSRYRRWSSGERSALLTHVAHDWQLGLLFEPYVEGAAVPLFLVADEGTVEEIARCLGDFFTAADASPA